MQNVPSLVTDFLLFFRFSTYHDFLPSSVNIFRLEIDASFFLILRTMNQYRPTIPSSTLTLFTSPSQQSPTNQYSPYVIPPLLITEISLSPMLLSLAAILQYLYCVRSKTNIHLYI